MDAADSTSKYLNKRFGLVDNAVMTIFNTSSLFAMDDQFPVGLRTQICAANPTYEMTLNL